ncbi:MAG: glutamine synthetase type III, partial [Rectinema sp.]|nr:glutamine synthetase type III [Rectinema sp.]
LIYLERYSKQVKIEAGMTIDLVRRSVIPAATMAAERYSNASSVIAGIGAPALVQETVAKKIAHLIARTSENLERLEKALNDALRIDDALERARAFRDQVVPRMDEVREACDEMEKLVPAELWPLPTYGELLFTL